MKTITLKSDNTFEHLWINSIHGQTIPSNAITVSDADFTLLSQNPHNKKYDMVSGQVVDYEKPFIFMDAKESKRLEIELKRDKALQSEVATVIANGETWQSDPNSMKELNDAITLSIGLGAVPDGIEWRDANNVNHTATLQLLLNIAAARAVQKNSIWQQSWAFKNQLDSLDSATADQEDIDSIVVNFS